MALIEAVLTYRPHTLGDGVSVPIGKTADLRVLRAIRDRLLEEATQEARMWRDIDPGVAAMRTGELDRLATTLAFLLPDEDPKPNLHPVGEKQAESNR